MSTLGGLSIRREMSQYTVAVFAAATQPAEQLDRSGRELLLARSDTLAGDSPGMARLRLAAGELAAECGGAAWG